jgi:hypothetical protein
MPVAGAHVKSGGKDCPSNGNVVGISVDFLDDAGKPMATRHRLFLMVGRL